MITVWERRSYKKDAVTGRDVPDESKRIPLLTYKNPRPAKWPQADYIVGNPPFLGTAKMREIFGDGYAETLRSTYPDVPESADFVLYWWHKAADLARGGKVLRFGLITTNSLRQTFARRVVQAHLTATPPLSLAFAIPDHPWVEAADGAAVRIAMTVGASREHSGRLLEVAAEKPTDDGSEIVTFTEASGRILSDLTIGTDASACNPLQANESLVSRGVQTIGNGFVVSNAQAREWMRFDKNNAKFLKPFLNGKDLTSTPRDVWVIDFFANSQEVALKTAPTLYQHLLVTVKPERDQSNRQSYRQNWWVLGEPQPMLRRMIADLTRYIVSPVTAKHRFFIFLTSNFLPDQALNVFAFDDAFLLGVLSSSIHVMFALAVGGTLEDRPRYNNSVCFDPFPFPDCTEPQRDRIRKIAEELDAHRKRVQAQHPGLTLTGMYKVLEKLRTKAAVVGRVPAPGLPNAVGPVPSPGVSPSLALTPKEKEIHDKGLVSILKQLHDDLDAAVFDAYGWPPTLTDAEILERLVALNAERAKEETQGKIRWLRPDYQIPLISKSPNPNSTLNLPEEKDTTKELGPKSKIKNPATAGSKMPWPKTLPERAKAIESALRSASGPITAETLAKQFLRGKPADITEILETLCTLGHAKRAKEKDAYIA
jgi:hypothetical protein